MRLLRVLAICAVVGVGFCGSAQAECPPWRPCGPGNSWGGNRWIPQGYYGADFRPACNAHDACYQTCANRRDCDRQFLNNMQCACANSSNPRACNRKARCYYMAARMLGGIYRQ